MKGVSSNELEGCGLEITGTSNEATLHEIQQVMSG